MTNHPHSARAAEPVTHRITVEYSAYYAVQEPDAPSAKPALLIATHGYGQSARSFMRDLAPLKDHDILVVAPQGMNAFYWQNNPPKIGFSWMTSFQRENAIADIVNYMGRLYDDVKDRYAFDEDRVFLLGFSQGSAVAYRFGASGLVRPAGVIACGGDLPPDVAERIGTFEAFPVLVVHGTQDQAMSFDKAKEGEGQLRDGGFDVTTHYFEGAHELPKDVVGEIVAWMGQQEGQGA